MANYSQIFVITALVASFGASANPCSTEPTEQEKRELCSGEEHPLAIKMCAESLEIERDKYGRVKSHKYKSDARIPPIELLNNFCSEGVLKDKAEVVDCRKTMRVRRNLDGRIVGYSYKIGSETIDRAFEGGEKPVFGDGGFLCKDEPKDSLSRKVCIDGLNFDQDGDFMTTYTHAAVSKFPTDIEAKEVCKKFAQGSQEFEYCKATTLVPRFTDGKLDVALAQYSSAEMPKDFVPMRPVCEKGTNEPQVEKLAAKDPIPQTVSEDNSSAPMTRRTPSSKSKCDGKTGDELKECIGQKTGEQTLIGFDGCKAVWGSRSDAKSRIGEGQGGDVASDKGPRRVIKE